MKNPAVSTPFSFLIPAIVLGLFCLNIALPVYAQNQGREIEFSVDDNGNNILQAAQILNGFVYVQKAGGDPNLDLIFDSTAMSLYIIEHNSQSYYKIDQGVISKAASMIESLSAVAESQEGVLADLLNTLGFSEEEEQANREVRKTDTVLSTAGINCQLFQQLKNGELESELCIAPKDGLTSLGNEYNTMVLFYQFGDQLMTKAGNILENIGFGLPRLTKLGEGGLPIMAFVVRDRLKVKVENIIPATPLESLFRIPAGYVQTPIPFLG